MNKKLSAILSLLLSAVLLLAGCTGVRHEPTESGTKSPASSDSIPESTQETNPAETSGEETSSLPISSEDAPKRCLTDLTGLTAGKAANTYLLDFIQPSLCEASPTLHGNFLLCANQVTFSTGEMPDENDEAYTSLTVFDISERQMTAELQLRGLYTCDFLDNGNIYCIESYYSEHFSAFIFDRDLNRLYSYQPDGDTSVTLAMFSSDGSYFAYVTDDPSSLYLLNTKTGELRKLALPEGSLYAASSNGKYLYLCQSLADRQGFVRIDTETGDVSQFELSDASYVQIRDGLITRISYDDLLIASDAETPAKSVMTAVGENAYAFCSLSGRVTVANYPFGDGNAICQVYDLAQKCVWRTEPQNPDTIGTFVLSDQGFAIIQYCDWEEDSYTYLLWDYLSEEPETAEVTVIPEGGIDQMTADIADNILKNTGITVFYGGAGNDFDASVYVSKTVTNSFAIYSSIREAEAFFRELPDGMAQELCASGHLGIRLYLCGKLYRTESTGITTAAALTFSEGAYRAIAIDISLGGIRQNLAHEISHIIDDRLNDLLLQDGVDLLGAWETMCPPGFSYSNSYNDEYGNLISDSRYTAYSAEPDENVWFVDAYARSFPTEDRARVFENLFVGNSYALRGEHLMQKARYYCAMLRYAFPSVRNAESPVWEQLTGKVDPSEFSDIFTPSDAFRSEGPDQSAANVRMSAQELR